MNTLLLSHEPPGFAGMPSRPETRRHAVSEQLHTFQVIRGEIQRQGEEAPAEFYQNLVSVLGASGQTSHASDSSKSSSTAAKQAHRLFRKGGVITSLDDYTSLASSTATGGGPPAQTPAGPSARLGPQIGSANVGYQLLKRAGWQEGQGLGSSQQGRSIPLAAFHQQARQGIGVCGTASDADVHLHNKHSRTNPTSSAPSQRPGTARQKQDLPVPDVPEALEVKRKRHQQMLQTEAEEDERKAIQRYMYRALNDVGVACTSDSNPLARPNKLTKTNPLL